MDFKTDALLALVILIGGWTGAIFTTQILDWTRFCQGVIGIIIVAGLTFLRFKMKNSAAKLK